MKNIVTFISFIGLLSCFVSCSNSGMGINKIIITDNMTATVNGIDCDSSTTIAAPLKLLVYYDTTGCQKCKLGRMWFDWNSYIELAKKSKNKFSVFFVVTPSNKESHENVIRSLKTYQSNYPVHFDNDKEFSKANNILFTETKNRVFLINKKGKILMQGSPIDDKTLEKKFYETIAKELQE